MDGPLVHCSPIFQQSSPTNRLCNPPSGSVLVPACRLKPSLSVSISRKTPLARCAFAAFTERLLFVLSRLAPLVTYHHILVRRCGARRYTCTHDPRLRSLNPLRLSRSTLFVRPSRSVSAVGSHDYCFCVSILSDCHCDQPWLCSDSPPLVLALIRTVSLPCHSYRPATSIPESALPPLSFLSVTRFLSNCV